MNDGRCDDKNNRKRKKKKKKKKPTTTTTTTNKQTNKNKNKTKQNKTKQKKKNRLLFSSHFAFYWLNYYNLGLMAFLSRLKALFLDVKLDAINNCSSKIKKSKSSFV